MRWKAFFFDRNEQDNNDAINNDNFGFKSRNRRFMRPPRPTATKPSGANCASQKNFI